MSLQESESHYGIAFAENALKSWKKLDHTIKEQFAKKLEKLVVDPTQAPMLRGDLHGLYKVKLKSSGYRLVYKIQDSELVILVLNVGKRENDEIYDM